MDLAVIILEDFLASIKQGVDKAKDTVQAAASDADKALKKHTLSNYKYNNPFSRKTTLAGAGVGAAAVAGWYAYKKKQLKEKLDDCKGNSKCEEKVKKEMEDLKKKALIRGAAAAAGGAALGGAGGAAYGKWDLSRTYDRGSIQDLGKKMARYDANVKYKW